MLAAVVATLLVSSLLVVVLGLVLSWVRGVLRRRGRVGVGVVLLPVLRWRHPAGAVARVQTPLPPPARVDASSGDS